MDSYTAAIEQRVERDRRRSRACRSHTKPPALGRSGRHPRHCRDPSPAGRRRGRGPEPDPGRAGPRPRHGGTRPTGQQRARGRGDVRRPVRRLDQLEREDLILVTTTQGQVVYRVDTVEQVKIVPPPPSDTVVRLRELSSSTPPTTSVPVGGTGGEERVRVRASVTTPRALRPHRDDRLTLVTSASAWPTNSSLATVVVARCRDARTADAAGRPIRRPERQRGPGRLLARGAARPPGLRARRRGAAVYFYRRSSTAVAYVLTTPPLMAFAIIAAEQVSRVLPALGLIRRPDGRPLAPIGAAWMMPRIPGRCRCAKSRPG